MPKVWNKRDPHCPSDAVYVGRPSPWGNPYKVGTHGNRAVVIEQYRQYLLRLSAHQRTHLFRTIRGKDLVCWCAPKPCHADVLLELANAADADET